MALIKILFHTLQGITSPPEAFFWPEALLPKSHDDTDIEEPLDGLQSGYSGYVNDVEDDDGLDDEEDDLSLDSCSLNVGTCKNCDTLLP